MLRCAVSRSVAQVFEVAGDVLAPQLAHNLCRLVAEQDSELHSAAVQVCGCFEVISLLFFLACGLGQGLCL